MLICVTAIKSRFLTPVKVNVTQSSTHNSTNTCIIGAGRGADGGGQIGCSRVGRTHNFNICIAGIRMRQRAKRGV